jgi:hypothetical protein
VVRNPKESVSLSGSEFDKKVLIFGTSQASQHTLYLTFTRTVPVFEVEFGEESSTVHFHSVGTC